MFAYPIALALGNERFSSLRFGGLVLGLVGVMLIVAPEGSLPDRAMILFVPLAMIAPFFYGLEGNVIARWGMAGLSPIDVLFGATLVAAALALATGQFIVPRAPLGAPELALIASSLINVVVYTAYVWLVARAGPVFAVQVSYLVTGFGVLWAILLLGEGYSGWVWSAMAVMLAGMFLVQPRPREAPLAHADRTATMTEDMSPES